MTRSIALLPILASPPAWRHPTRRRPSCAYSATTSSDGHGNDGKVDLRRAARVIRDSKADIVLLQEIDKERASLGPKGPDGGAFATDRTTKPLGAFMPYQGGEYGMGVMSRLPIIASSNHRLPDGLEPRTALDARVRLANGDELLLCGVHLYMTAGQRLAQAQELVDIYAKTTTPMILGGDFNSRPGSPVMQLIEKPLDQHRQGRRSLHDVVDAPALRDRLRPLPPRAALSGAVRRCSRRAPRLRPSTGYSSCWKSCRIASAPTRASRRCAVSRFAAAAKAVITAQP